MFNSVCSTFIAGLTIYYVVFFTRNRPQIIVGYPTVNVFRPGASQLIADPISYQCRIDFKIFNLSVHDAYNFRFIAVHGNFPESVEFEQAYRNLLSNQEQSYSISFMLTVDKHSVMQGLPETQEMDSKYTAKQKQKYSHAFKLKIEYRTPRGRLISNWLTINPNA